MDYKKVLRLHYVNRLSSREISVCCGDCGKSAVNEFLRRFRECPQLSYPLSEDMTNEYLETLLYQKPGVTDSRLFYRDFDKEAAYKALQRKGGTLKHLWQKYDSFSFVEGKLNVGIYGVTGVGKSYFLDACCNEACRRNIRCKYVDYSELLEELISLDNGKDLKKYNKRIKYYARIPLLFIDDFAISRYSEEGIKILYHLVKKRTDLGTSTLFTCQYSPDEWNSRLSDNEGCYGKLDGIRRRLTTGFTVLIEKAES